MSWAYKFVKITSSLSHRMTHFLTILFFASFCVCGNSTGNVQVAIHPKNVSAIVGAPVTLICMFNIPVNCVWHHNGELVSTSKEHNSRLSYAGDHDSVKYADCSLSIAKLRQEDAGKWRCSSRGNHLEDSKFSNDAVVTVLNENDQTLNSISLVTESGMTNKTNSRNSVTNTVYTSNLRTLIGFTKTLTCKTKFQSNIVWKRRNQRMFMPDIAGRYKTDCGSLDSCDINIDGVLEIDFGDWTSATLAGDQSEALLLCHITLAKAKIDESSINQNVVWIFSLISATVFSACTILLIVYRLRLMKAKH